MLLRSDYLGTQMPGCVPVMRSEKHEKQDPLVLSKVEPFMHHQQYTIHNHTSFLCLKTPLQQVHGQSFISALCLAYLVSHKPTVSDYR